MRRDTISLHALLVAVEDALVGRIAGLGLSREVEAAVSDQIADVIEQARRLHPQCGPMAEALGREDRR